MCDKELLIGYVYDELEAAERKAIQQHLASCRECRDEAQALRGTRSHLAAWQVPAVPSLRPMIEVAPASRFRLNSSWGLAAAAALVLAAVSAIANLQIQTVDGGVMIRTGWSQAAVPVASNAAPQVPEI